MDASNALHPIHPAVLERTPQLAAEFAEGVPFRHVVMNDFLTPSAVEPLLAQFPPFEARNAMGDTGNVGGKATVPGIRRLGDAYAALDDLIRSSAFLDWLSQVTGIPNLLYDPYYLGGGTHENLHGQGLEPHIDFNYHPSERWHRRLNLILYLNPEWSPDWGGALELFSAPRDRAPERSVAPLLNTCVLFETTEHSWHGFDTVRLPADVEGVSRKSIALYFYTDDRPAEETAPKHTTIYRQKGLPEWCEEGAQLDASRIEELRMLLARRDAHADHLYAENSRLLQAQEKGLVGQLLYLLKRAYVRARR
ncbi:2OG-Fe(II) oxygenase [Oleiagrimonas soli]|uniref:Membrane protein n=1 Tax=Oleiagrimonas soli TaxID=1543381 RepID=A0A099CY53_9GAMM|nr:2OG-Fe(II) oxygenase [Oleiagrimonas soli]KGI78704.1 membrane protein [Oleiagrimonas soli]MBB6183966.1 hypothetical protein [Oleiagrimonas soli]